MTDRTDLSRVNPHRLSRLWSHVVPVAGGMTGGPGPAAAGVDEPAADLLPADLAALLRATLSSPLVPPPDPGPGEDVAVTYAALFAQPAPPADALRRAKARFKPQMTRDDAELPREVAGVLYFAAVAAARVRGAVGVSDLPDVQVAKGAAWALRRPWLAAAGDDRVVALFRQAAALAAGAPPDGADSKLGAPVFHDRP